ncbi:MAG: hypothetical protein CL605_09520 [Altibacter sp.]|nr:hypothetical protein [Altibacter sp.]
MHLIFESKNKMGSEVTFPISELSFKLISAYKKLKSEIINFLTHLFRTGALGSPLFKRIKKNGESI